MQTILIVDDDEHIREFVRKSCGTLATVIEAADGAQAIAAARWSHPDVVVMDLDMPVLDGFEAARQLKCDPSLGDPVLVALTGNETANAVPRARAAGYAYFVRKETNARAFVETIARLLEEAGARARPAPVAESAAPASAVPKEKEKTTRRSPKKRAPARPKPAKASKAAKPARKRAAVSADSRRRSRARSTPKR